MTELQHTFRKTNCTAYDKKNHLKLGQCANTAQPEQTLRVETC